MAIPIGKYNKKVSILQVSIIKFEQKFLLFLVKFCIPLLYISYSSDIKSQNSNCISKNFMTYIKF